MKRKAVSAAGEQHTKSAAMNPNLFTRIVGLSLCLLIAFYQLIYFNDQLLMVVGYRVRRHPPFIVHLDLKGAAPRSDFISQLVSWLGTRKASGILVEYEAMFPFDGKLADLTSSHRLSHEDISDILLTAEKRNMDVIPYVNTFTNMEHVVDNSDIDDMVKAFGGRRRNSWNTCHHHKLPESLITEMVDQVLSLHPNSRYVYIGSSQLAEINNDPECLLMAKEKRIGELFYRHVQYISQHIHHNWPGVTVLAAADALVDLSEVQLLSIAEFMQPVVVETGTRRSNLTDELLMNGVHYFSKVWGASSYKGTGRPGANYVHLRDTLANHVRWRAYINEVRQSGFAGLLLMGPSRHKHCAPLCELLPVALPSLVLAMDVIHSNFTLETGRQTAVGLGFNSFVYERPFIEAGRLKFPGSTVFKAVSELEVTMNNNQDRDMITIDSDFVKRIETALRTVYPKHVVKEWMLLKVTAWTKESVHDELRPFSANAPGAGRSRRDQARKKSTTTSMTAPTKPPMKLSMRGEVWLGGEEVGC